MRYVRGVLTGLAASVQSLKGSPRELWLVFLVKALESYSYFSMSLIYVLYLTDNFGVGDVAAGASYGLWGMLIVAWGVILGPAIDYLGIRSSLIACFVLEGVTRIIMATTTSLPMLYTLMYTMLPASGALGVPVMTIAVKRYSAPANRGFAYGLFYTVMNLAALVNGFLVDFLRLWLCDGFNISSLSSDHWLNDGNRLVVASGALTSLIALAISLMFNDTIADKAQLRPGSADVDEEEQQSAWPLLGKPSTRLGVHDETPPAATRLPRRTASAPNRHPSMRFCARSVALAIDLYRSVRELGSYPGFWKYVTLSLFLINLRQTFRYLDSLLPKYMQRAIGCGAPIGSVYAINPTVVVLLVPVVTAATASVPHFDMIHFGAYITASSSMWAWLFASSPLLGCALYVLQLSIGEAVWSPRWFDYTMDVAPEGREGIFGAIASAPLFLAKLPSGMLSGFLLERYCPEVGGGGCRGAQRAACGGAAATPQASGAVATGTGRCEEVLWLAITVVTMASPVLVTAFQGWLQPGERVKKPPLRAGSISP